MKKMLGQIGAAPGAGNETCKTLPKTGTVCAQWVRCGRPNCRCARSELHGPYAYHLWREGGRLRKRYIRLADADAARAACDERRRRERQERRVAADAWQTWRALVRELRTLERSWTT